MFKQLQYNALFNALMILAIQLPIVYSNMCCHLLLVIKLQQKADMQHIWWVGTGQCTALPVGVAVK